MGKWVRGKTLAETLAETPEEKALAWLDSVHGVPYNGENLAIVRGIYAANRGHDGFDKCKCLPLLIGRRKHPEWDIGDAWALGLFDPDTDYHTCWDRTWAAHEGLCKEDALRIEKWDYGKREVAVWSR